MWSIDRNLVSKLGRDREVGEVGEVEGGEGGSVQSNPVMKANLIRHVVTAIPSDHPLHAVLRQKSAKRLFALPWPRFLVSEASPFSNVEEK